MTSVDYAPLHQAVAALAGVCDYASSEDNKGFSGAHAYLGHALADMGVTAWDDEAALYAWDMLRYYRHTQLAAWDIKWDELPVPPGGAELAAERRQAVRDRTKVLVRNRREEKYRKARSYVKCEDEGAEVILGFPYDPAMVAEARNIVGRRYEGSDKTNRYPFSSLPLVIAFADKHGIEVTPEVRVLIEVAKLRHAEALKKAEAEAAARTALPHARLGDNGKLVIDKDWDENTTRLAEALRGINRGRSTWDKAANLHRPPHRDAVALQKIISDFGLTVSPEAQQLLDGEEAAQKENLANSVAVTAPAMSVPGLDESVTLKDVQYAGIHWAVEHRRTWIADEMGFGKSLTGLAAVAVDNAYPLVIVCLPNLTLNWVNELKRFPYIRFFVAEGQKAQPIPRGTDVVIIGSAALGYTPTKGKGKVKEFPWVKMIKLIRPKALILDEAQIAKEETSNRTKAIKQLSAAIIEINGMVLALTGTALMNRPAELGPQLDIMGRIDEFGGMGAFLMRYCKGESNQFGTKFDGAHHLDELHFKLRAYGIMIRRSDPALLGLKPCDEYVIEVPQGQLDPRAMTEYLEAERDIVRFLGEQAAKIAKRFGLSGKDVDDARVRAAMKAKSAEHLVQITKLRELIGQAKIGYARQWASKHTATGEKVMLAAHHQSVTIPLAQALGGLKIVGEQTVQSKENDKYVFQCNPKAMVITVAIEAGGMGHTLTAARLGLQVEFPWTPGSKNQMKKRLHRIGQTRKVDYYLMVAKGTVDEYMLDVLTTKQARLDAVLDGKFAEGVVEDKESVASEVAWRLAMQGLNNVGGRA